MYLHPEVEEKQIKALTKDLRTVGVRGKIDLSTYKCPKTVNAVKLEQALVKLGWTCKRAGMYYTEWTPYEKIGDHTGLYEKDGVVAHVIWGNTSSTNPPSLVLRAPKQGE